MLFLINLLKLSLLFNVSFSYILSFFFLELLFLLKNDSLLFIVSLFNNIDLISLLISFNKYTNILLFLEFKLKFKVLYPINLFVFIYFSISE